MLATKPWSDLLSLIKRQTYDSLVFYQHMESQIDRDGPGFVAGIALQIIFQSLLSFSVKTQTGLALPLLASSDHACQI